MRGKNVVPGNKTDHCSQDAREDDFVQPRLEDPFLQRGIDGIVPPSHDKNWEEDEWIPELWKEGISAGNEEERFGRERTLIRRSLLIPRR